MTGPAEPPSLGDDPRDFADLREILVDGSRRARVVAQETMARVRDAVKLAY